MAAAGAFFVTVRCLIRGHHVYKEVWNPSTGEAFVCFAEEENSHDRRAVISTSNDISKCNIASKPSSSANTVVKHCSRGVLSSTALAEIRGSANFRVAQ